MNALVHDAGAVVRLSLADGPLEFYWGHPHQLGSAAYWTSRARSTGSATYRMTSSLRHEVAACLLGGYGIPAEIGWAAYVHLASAGILDCASPQSAEIERLLSQPLQIGGGSRRYRFPRQRAERIAVALDALTKEPPPTDASLMRVWLRAVPGIGEKTAAWIVRNVTDSDVCIVDIHLTRAGVAAGFFRPSWRLPRDYPLFEAAFLAVAAQANVSAAKLDSCIWSEFRTWPIGFRSMNLQTSPGRATRDMD